MQKLLFLGGDVSKGMCDFTLVNAEGQIQESNFQLDDNRTGHQFLFDLIKKWKVDSQYTKLIIGLESTGGYENNWYRGLRAQSKQLNIEVFRINPKRIYHEGKSEGRRSKTDAVSAAIIAGFLRKNYGERDLSPQRLQTDAKFANMRSLHKYIQRLVKQSTQTKNALEKMLYSFLPELLIFKGETYSQWFLTLLKKYPSRLALLKAGVKRLSKIPYLSEQRAQQIVKALKQSVGSPADEYSTITISEQAEDIMRLQQKIKRLRQQLNDLALPELEEDCKIVCSIRGIGLDTAVGLLMEIESVHRFEKANSLPAYWGVNPTIKQSGDKTFYIGMSKDGSPSARALLYLAAKNVCIHEPYFKAYYAKFRAKGKKHREALGIVMAKLARVLVGMLKSRKEFDAGVDIYHQTKKAAPKPEKTNCVKPITQRRYQNATVDAPISARQRKKRKQGVTASS